MLELLPKERMPHGFGMKLMESPRLKRKKVTIPEPRPNESPEFLALKEKYFERKERLEKRKVKSGRLVDMNNILGGN